MQVYPRNAAYSRAEIKKTACFIGEIIHKCVGDNPIIENAEKTIPKWESDIWTGRGGHPQIWG